jgi:hypothetical protein
MWLWQRSYASLQTPKETLKTDSMWQEENTWLHYVKNIIAADIHNAVFLANYLNKLSFTKHYTASLEVMDLNRYKVIRNKSKIREILHDRMRPPFVFIIHKN